MAAVSTHFGEIVYLKVEPWSAETIATLGKRRKALAALHSTTFLFTYSLTHATLMLFPRSLTAFTTLLSPHHLRSLARAT